MEDSSSVMEPDACPAVIEEDSAAGTDLPEVLLQLKKTARDLERANERMRRELEAAALVQQSLLPHDQFRVPGLKLGWRLRPCCELAGDLLNCIRLDENHFSFFVLDVSGHGVAAALLSVQVSRLMSPSMSESLLLKQPLKEPPWYRLVEPHVVVEQLNSQFQMSWDLAQYFTILYGMLEIDSGRVRFASAGHPGPILVPADGESTATRCPSHPVGLFENTRVAKGELTLNPGDRLWLFSDGVTEVVDDKQRELGVDGLKQWVTTQRGVQVAKAVEETMGMVEKWCSPAQPADDCTLLSIERQ